MYCVQVMVVNGCVYGRIGIQQTAFLLPCGKSTPKWQPNHSIRRPVANAIQGRHLLFRSPGVKLAASLDHVKRRLLQPTATRGGDTGLQ